MASTENMVISNSNMSNNMITHRTMTGGELMRITRGWCVLIELTGDQIIYAQLLLGKGLFGFVRCESSPEIPYQLIRVRDSFSYV